MNDAELLSSVPDLIAVGGFFKARPATEGGHRYLYLEASNEGLDQQDEIIMAKALAESSDYFMRYGNVDIDHLTKLGPRLGIPDAASYEIGQPRDVRVHGGTTFVKAEIYQGTGPAAENANLFWSSVTELKPPQRWYPSVGGQALSKSIEVDSKTKAKRVIIRQVRWNNIGMSKTPVNQHVRHCSTMPLGAFAKAFSAGGLDLTKALEAGYGTDSSALSGGGALREQSLEGKPANYFDFRNRVAKALRNRDIRNPGAGDIAKYSETAWGLSADEAAEHTERFMADLAAGIKRGSK